MAEARRAVSGVNSIGQGAGIRYFDFGRILRTRAAFGQDEGRCMDRNADRTNQQNRNLRYVYAVVVITLIVIAVIIWLLLRPSTGLARW